MLAELPAQAGDGDMTLTVEDALEHGKLWCLVSHMWKMLCPQGVEMEILSLFSVVKKGVSGYADSV